MPNQLFILEAPVMNKFRAKRPLGFYNIIKGHTGVDLRYIFQEVPSPVSGVVEDTKFQTEMGNTIYLKDNETGAIHVMSHFKSFNVKKGQTVHRGDILGLSGNTGIKSTAPHLHYEVIYFINKNSAQKMYNDLVNKVMTRSLNGYSGHNIDPTQYLLLIYGKYHINSKGQNV